MLAVEPGHRDQRQMERRAKPARRSSRFMYPKTAARRLHQSRSAQKNQNPQNGHLMARFDWGLGAICFGASPVAAVFGSAPGSATSPEHRIHSNPAPPADPLKQDISTLLGIGHFYFALTLTIVKKRRVGPAPASQPILNCNAGGLCRRFASQRATMASAKRHRRQDRRRYDLDHTPQR
jgi:hypothetical protein